MFSHVICVLLSHIISYSDTKVLVLVVMECKRASMTSVCELIFFTLYLKVNRVLDKLGMNGAYHVATKLLIEVTFSHL